MSWSESMARLKDVLLTTQGASAVITTAGGVVITSSGYIAPVSDRRSNGSIASLNQLDFITAAGYSPKRGDVITIGAAVYRVKDRDGEVWRECDNAGSLIRVHIVREA